MAPPHAVGHAFVTDGLAAFVGGLFVGGLAIHAAAEYLAAPADPVGGLADAVMTALLGTLAWLLVGWVPLVGSLLALCAWVGVIKWRYPFGWTRAALTGVGAWLVAVVVVAALSLVGVELTAVGVPGV